MMTETTKGDDKPSPGTVNDPNCKQYPKCTLLESGSFCEYTSQDIVAQVRHACALTAGHKGMHACKCGAKF